MLIAFSFQYFRCKVTNKRAKCKRKTCFSFQFRVVVTYLKYDKESRIANLIRIIKYNPFIFALLPFHFQFCSRNYVNPPYESRHDICLILHGILHHILE